MKFSIHLKDNTLVKNKKRWSQVMYMSYVLKFLAKSDDKNEEEKYILCTDADVKFKPDSIEALLDLMCRDPTVGAVCARTHPMGDGPVVWYQKFEYAIGHWFQKTAEHVLGSVLCAPGCFSIYRCKALEEILEKYCQEVESSFDFLTKDMGEDRWLCTLLIERGWRIEYCAISENSTNCPSEFEEFYKQRRRWIASTLANLILIIQNWKSITKINYSVSLLFIIYQAILLAATIITPSTVMLIVAGGVDFAWGVNAIAAVILQIILSIVFALVCLRASQNTQMMLAKIYTAVYAVIMCGVAIGTAEQVVTDITSNSEYTSSNISWTKIHPLSSEHISVELEVSMTTLYFGVLIVIFVLTAFLHLKEWVYLFHGIVFLMCLPSAYLVLIIYSICNLTDSSWGTREGDTASNTGKKKTSWTERFQNIFQTIFFCMANKPEPDNDVDPEAQAINNGKRKSLEETPESSSDEDDSYALKPFEDSSERSGSQDSQKEKGKKEVPKSVEDWFSTVLKFESKYAEIFKEYGYENTLFIKSLTETDLDKMGITKKCDVHFLMAKISELPDFEIELKVPTNVKAWLEEIGLSQYNDNFRRNNIQTPSQMEILKKFDPKDIKKELKIKKDGHIRRLMNAIEMLRKPNKLQQNVTNMRRVINEIDLQKQGKDEDNFWSDLVTGCLKPNLKAFSIDSEVKVKLAELRKGWLIIMAVANFLWLIVIITLATKANLTLLGANPIGLLFLIIFGFILFVQFLAMLVHRFYTLCHYLARASWINAPLRSSWSFNDKPGPQTEDGSAGKSSPSSGENYENEGGYSDSESETTPKVGQINNGAALASFGYESMSLASSSVNAREDIGAARSKSKSRVKKNSYFKKTQKDEKKLLLGVEESTIQ